MSGLWASCGVPDLDRSHHPWAPCDPHAHQPWALSDHCLAGLGERQPQPLSAVMPRETSPDAIDLIGRLLCFEPSRRPSAAGALAHVYLADFHEEAEGEEAEGEEAEGEEAEGDEEAEGEEGGAVASGMAVPPVAHRNSSGGADSGARRPNPNSSPTPDSNRSDPNPSPNPDLNFGPNPDSSTAIRRVLCEIEGVEFDWSQLRATLHREACFWSGSSQASCEVRGRSADSPMTACSTSPTPAVGLAAAHPDPKPDPDPDPSPSPSPSPTPAGGVAAAGSAASAAAGGPGCACPRAGSDLQGPGAKDQGSGPACPSAGSELRSAMAATRASGEHGTGEGIGEGYSVSEEQQTSSSRNRKRQAMDDGPNELVGGAGCKRAATH